MRLWDTNLPSPLDLRHVKSDVMYFEVATKFFRMMTGERPRFPAWAAVVYHSRRCFADGTPLPGPSLTMLTTPGNERVTSGDFCGFQSRKIPLMCVIKTMKMVPRD